MAHLFTLGPQAISASGQTGPIPTLNWQNFWLALVTGTPTGTTPTFVLHIDGIDAFGNQIADIITLGAGFSLTTVAGSTHASFGTSATPAGTYDGIPSLIVLRWVVTGTTPNYPNVQISLQGR
jgi:hypothetical protein